MWIENYKQRLKEHCIANGYYSPNKPVDLSQLEERWKKFIDVLESKEEKVKISPFMSDDDYMLINKTARLYEFMRDKAGEKKGQHKESKHFLIVNNYPFIVEDLCGRVEAAQKKLEEAERERERERDNPTILPLSLTLTNKIMIR